MLIANLPSWFKCLWKCHFLTKIVYCINLYRDLHKTAISDRITELHHSSVKISEHGKQRLHKLYMQDKSSKPKILIYTYWKVVEAGNSNSYSTLHRNHRSTMQISERLHDCTKIISHENLASWTSKLKAWNSSLILQTRDLILMSWNLKHSSFEMPGLRVTLLLTGTVPQVRPDCKFCSNSFSKTW